MSLTIGKYRKGDHVLVLDLDLPSWVMCTIESISYNFAMHSTVIVAHAWPPLIGPKGLPIMYAITGKDVPLAVRLVHRPAPTL